jgi:hypothetical protein
VRIQTGISDGNVTELVAGDIKEADEVIVGVETLRSGRKPGSLPPGFGAGQPRRGSSRDRGL